LQPYVQRIAFAVVRDAALADDVSQISFERAWRLADRYDSRRGSVTTWIGTIARHAAIDELARNARAQTQQMRYGSGFEASEDPMERALVSETGEELRAALATMPRDQARAVVLASVRGLSARQIAELDQIPLGTAKTRIRAGKLRLRSAMTLIAVRTAGSSRSREAVI
jgi:RNA polymerase sigma-70 factor (ECF subfamily)